MKIAILYDWIDTWGGAERVLLTLHEVFPTAHFYTSYYDPTKAPWADKLDVRTSFLQKLPSFIRKNRIFSTPLYPFAFESLNLGSYDIVVSVTSSFSKGVITGPNTLHLCYLLSPTRFLWDQPEVYPMGAIRGDNSYTRYLKKWDLIASQRPDRIIAISKHVQELVKKYYNRESTLLYPPFDMEYWSGFLLPTQGRDQDDNGEGEYYLVVSRLEPYKKIDLVIKAFNNTPRKLIIVGTGSQESTLRSLARENIQFRSHTTDEELAYLYSRSKALIMPQKEEFGYTALEAQFFGCPVVSYQDSGAEETIIEGKTGIFFSEQSQKSLIEALEKFEAVYYTVSTSTKQAGSKNVEQFDKKIFTKTFMHYLKTNLS